MFLPLYTLGTLILLKFLIPNPNFPAITTPRGEAKLFKHFEFDKNHTIAVLPHPNSTTTTQFLNSVNDLWLTMSIGPGKYPIKWDFYNSSETLQSSYRKDPFKMKIAVVFQSDDPVNGPLKYEIRTNPIYTEIPPTNAKYSSPASCRQTDSTFSGLLPIESGDSCPINQYYFSGFLALQALLDYTKIHVSRIFIYCRRIYILIRTHLKNV